MRTSSMVRTVLSRTAGVVALAVLAVGATGPLAAAHDGTDHDSTGQGDSGQSAAEADRQHAKDDLAGTSITEIEQGSAAAAKQRQAAGEASGDRPAGYREPAVRMAQKAVSAGEDADTATADSSAPRSGVSTLQAAAAADPAALGRWSEVVDTDVIPVFTALLPNGKVLVWDSVGDAPKAEDGNSFTRAMVFDPTTSSQRRVDVQGYNIFCAGYVQLYNGNVLVAGGNTTGGAGIVQTHLFDWKAETWTRGPDMAAARWYPSVAALANGEAAIVGGGPSTAEVFQLDNRLRQLTGFSSYAGRSYPYLVPRPDGQLQQIGPNVAMDTIDTVGTGRLVLRQNRSDNAARWTGGFATYDTGKSLVVGGGAARDANGVWQSLPTTRIVDTTVADKVSDRASGSMQYGRRQHNTTILADGSVLATGGFSSGPQTFINLDAPVYAAERWDPATGTWTTLASAARTRQYHSTATLLPDGRVMTGGGGICGDCVKYGYLEKNVEYFSPPYLFAPDGSGRLADRPEITSAPPAVDYATAMTLRSPQAASIRKLGLVRLGAPTHGMDQGQKYVPLSFTASGETITAKAPSGPTIAEPGYYMLFAVDAAGVPSVAKTVLVNRAKPPAPGANLAKGKPATQSSTNQWGVGAAHYGVDGLLNPATQTNAQTMPWWQVDLGRSERISQVVLHNRLNTTGSMLNGAWVLVSDRPFASTDFETARRQSGVRSFPVGTPAPTTVTLDVGGTARYVRVQLPGSGSVSLREVEVRAG